MRKASRTGLVILALLVSGCANIDFDYPKTESMTIANTDQTHLGTRVAQLTAAQVEGTSGFYPLIDGIEANTMSTDDFER